MSTEVARILREAADLIEPPGRWTKAALARDGKGEPCEARSVDAESWCVRGALVHVSGFIDAPTWLRVLTALRLAAGSVVVATWNDDQTSVEPVVAALRAAADAVEAEEARNG